MSQESKEQKLSDVEFYKDMCNWPVSIFEGRFAKENMAIVQYQSWNSFRESVHAVIASNPGHYPDNYICYASSIASE